MRVANTAAVTQASAVNASTRWLTAPLMGSEKATGKSVAGRQVDQDLSRPLRKPDSEQGAGARK